MVHNSLRKKRWIAVAALLACLTAQAFERPFPANAVRGKMTPGYFPDVLIDGKLRQLAPSARIFNQDNLIELPAAIRGSDLVVNYTLDSWGNIDRIWLLTEDEARQPAPSATPVSPDYAASPSKAATATSAASPSR